MIKMELAILPSPFNRKTEEELYDKFGRIPPVIVINLETEEIVGQGNFDECFDILEKGGNNLDLIKGMNEAERVNKEK